MGPFGDAWAASSSSPGRTRTYNPSVNSRMLCRLSYRGRLRMRLYGPGVKASRLDGDGVQRLFERLHVVPDTLLLVQVFCVTFGPFARQKLQADPRLRSIGPGRHYLLAPSEIRALMRSRYG